jgi:hypothetical protein
VDLLESDGKNFVMKEFLADKQFSLVNKLRTMGLLIDIKQKHKRRVLTEEKLDNIGARLEHTPRKSLKDWSVKV